MEALGMIQKGTDKHTIMIADTSSRNEIKKIHFTDFLIALGEFYQCDWKSKIQMYRWSIEYI